MLSRRSHMVGDAIQFSKMVNISLWVLSSAYVAANPITHPKRHLLSKKVADGIQQRKSCLRGSRLKLLKDTFSCFMLFVRISLACVTILMVFRVSK